MIRAHDLPKIMTAEQFRRFHGVGEIQLANTPQPPRSKQGDMNKTETRYAQMLEAQLRVGEIAWWEFEPLKLRLADHATFWTPDFLVIRDGLKPLLIDVKGTRSNGKPYVEEDAQLKIKFAAQRFPFWRFIQTWYTAQGWLEKEY